jgi:hypothetical protein
MAARIVRPVNSTSSTRTTVRPVMSKPILRLVHLRGLGLHPDVVAVEGDVERPNRHRDAFDALDLGGEPVREVIASVRDAHEHHAVRAFVTLDDLVGDAGEGAADVVGVEQRARHPDTGAVAEPGTPAQDAGQGPWVERHVHIPFPVSRDRT